jgi:DNA-binding LytR/AlgR family response regulator
VESLKDYIKIVTSKKTIVTKQPISSLEELLPADSFIRIHRSYIIAVNKVDSFNADSVEIRKSELPIGRFYKQDVGKLLNSSSGSRHANDAIK